MTKEVFTQLNNILIEYCSESIHDMLHVYRVLSFVLDIAQNEKEIVDMDILITVNFHIHLYKSLMFKNASEHIVSEGWSDQKVLRLKYYLMQIN